MKIRCPSCNVLISLNTSEIPKTGIEIVCEVCGHFFNIKKEQGSIVLKSQPSIDIHETSSPTKGNLDSILDSPSKLDKFIKIFGFIVSLFIIVTVILYFSYKPAYLKISKTAINTADRFVNIFSSKPFVSRFALVYNNEGKKKFYENSYASLKEASSLFINGFAEDKSYPENIAFLSQTYCYIGSVSSDLILLNKCLQISQNVLSFSDKNISALTAKAIFYLAKARISFYQAGSEFASEELKSNVKADYKEALKIFNILAQAVPDDIARVNFYAQALMFNPAFDSKVEQLFLSNTKKNYLDSMLHLSILYLINRNYSKSKQYASKILELNGNHERAAAMLNIISNEFETYQNRPTVDTDYVSKKLTYSDDLLVDYINSYITARRFRWD